MTPTLLQGISSGTHYRVTRADGGLPESVADFVGAAHFLIHQAEQNLRIEGVGHLDPRGAGVHFHEKDPDHEGRDVRVWHIRVLPDDRMIAEHISTF